MKLKLGRETKEMSLPKAKELTMLPSEEFQILSEFRENKFADVPPNRSKKRFLGNFFASIAMNHIAKHVPLKKYKPVLGPVWMRGLERVEWDGAIVKKDSEEIFPRTSTTPSHSAIKPNQTQNLRK